MDVYEQNVEQIKNNFLNKNNDNYINQDNKFKE